MKGQGYISDASTVLRTGAIKPSLTNTCMKTLDYTRYRQLIRGLSLRKPLEEDDWKAVFEKIERTVVCPARLVCSAGDKPAMARVRSHVVKMAGKRETSILKPIEHI